MAGVVVCGGSGTALGHEGSGVVADVGPGVRKVQKGDHVVMHWMKGSGIDCSPPRFGQNGTTISAGWVTTFSEYTIVSENRVTAIDKDVPFDVAALLGCAVTTGLGIVMNDANLRLPSLEHVQHFEHRQLGRPGGS